MERGEMKRYTDEEEQGTGTGTDCGKATIHRENGSHRTVEGFPNVSGLVLADSKQAQEEMLKGLPVCAINKSIDFFTKVT